MQTRAFLSKTAQKSSVLPAHSKVAKTEKPPTISQKAVKSEVQSEMEMEAEQPWGMMAANVMQSSAGEPGRRPSELVVQRKMMFGEVGDRYEEEADHLAPQIVSQINSLEGVFQPNVLKSKDIPKIQLRTLKPTMQIDNGTTGKDVPFEIESEITRARGSGYPLEPELENRLRVALRTDFSNVRVHTDAQADALNRLMKARAFATQNDVFFRAGEYQPQSRIGQELIVHELIHVIQQNRSGMIQSEPYGTSHEVKAKIQLMSIANGRNVISYVRTQVPDAGNKLLELLATWGKSWNRKQMCDEATRRLTNGNGLNFGTSDLANIVPRAGVAYITKGAVCDNYQEMTIAEIARNLGYLQPGDAVHPETYPGHSYVSVRNNNNPNPDNDLILDAWRDYADFRSSFSYYGLNSKYRTSYTQWPQVQMRAGLNWLIDPHATVAVNSLLLQNGIVHGTQPERIERYMRDFTVNITPRDLGGIFLR